MFFEVEVCVRHKSGRKKLYVLLYILYTEDKTQWCLLYFKMLNAVFCICFLFRAIISHLCQDVMWYLSCLTQVWCFCVDKNACSQ